jgi:hypothetical protein
MTPLLEAATPELWLSSHLDAYFGAPADAGEAAQGRWLTVAELVADDAEILSLMADRLVVEPRLPRPAAATYVASWTGGTLAGAIGYSLAAASAGFVVDIDAIRWHQHPDGWLDRADISDARVVVAADHPWSGLPGVHTVADAREVRLMTVLAMINALTPVIDACHRLAPIGKAGLWNEVADGFGMSVAYRPSLPVRQAAVDALKDALRCAGPPWKSYPEIRIVDGPAGAVYIGQKGGCCLLYTRSDRSYCSTCSFRERSDCESRQLAWIGQERAKQSPIDQSAT